MHLLAEPDGRLTTVERGTASLLLPGITIFLSAFLLFQLQPMLAKMILPWFGGSAAVWTTCVLFFQTVLFLGYEYAHWLTEQVRPRLQGWVHVTLLAVSCVVLPVVPREAWKPSGTDEPVTGILILLACTAGLPYFLLSSTSPLTQAWIARRGLCALPYRYYALSNLASLLALAAYPIVIEPFVTTHAQARVWSVAYIAFALLMSVLSLRTGSPAHGPRLEAHPDVIDRPRARDQVIWLLLAALTSTLSLATTNHLCQNVAPIPFLWVLPLGIYLLSLTLCFEGAGWRRRNILLPLHACAIGGAALLLVTQTPETPVRLVVPLLAVILFVLCMYLHGELADRKPAARYLTRYYLMVSLGGMLGGLLISIGAPYALTGYYEFPLALAVCAMFTLLLEYRKHWAWDLVWTGTAVGSLVACIALISSFQQARVTVRNFYGGLRILESSGGTEPRRTMAHGTISHGFQFLKAERRHDPTAYFAPGSGVQIVLESFRRPQLRVGIIGLGAGTLASYGRPGEFFRFYEINPQVAELARSQFTFLSDSAAKVEVAIGDGRLSLEREPEHWFDVIVVDAFSGDSIPVHLLTVEAMRLYLSRLRPDGAVILHVSNSALALAPVVEKIATQLGMDSLVFRATNDVSLGRSLSEWVLVADPRSIDRRPALRSAGQHEQAPSRFRLWTDDYSNLFQILK